MSAQAPVGVIPSRKTVRRIIEVAVFQATLGNCTLDCMRCANSWGGLPQLLDTLKPKSRHAGYRWGLNKGSVLSFRLQCFFRSNSVRPPLPPFESGSQSQNSKESSAGVQRREGELHIPDWEKPRNFLFPGASLTVQLLHSFESTSDSVNGLLPDFILDADCENPVQSTSFATIFRTLRFHEAEKTAESAA
jgi:hypothetical protein